MTTGAPDTVIEVAGRRLNPQELAEWQLLLTHLEISEGFSFVVLLVPDADWANACRLAISHSLEAQQKSLLTVDFSDSEDFKTQLPGRLLELHTSERTGAVWLEQTVSDTSPQFAEWYDAWRGMVARLNQVRNSLRRHFNVALIFVGAEWIQGLIRETAPDLWSVRTLVTCIKPLEESAQFSLQSEGTPESQLEGLAIDPDLALRSAASLRGQSGKELALAQLLYRAGLGLIARSRWKEAEVVLREAIDLQRALTAPDETLASSLYQLGYDLEWQYKFDEASALIQAARELYQKDGNVSGEANCIKLLGDIALDRSDYESGQAYYEEALPLYHRTEEILGEANCVQRLGDIALRRSDYTIARTRFEEALLLYRRAGIVVGEANCIKFLGDIALERSDFDSARAHYEEALPLYRRTGHVLGEANCVNRLAYIAFRQLDLDSATAYCEEALPLYRRLGNIVGEANCIQLLGNIALERSDFDSARIRYEEALPLFRRAGQLLGEANSIKNLGDIALRYSDHVNAKKYFQEAFSLYSRIHNVLGQANCIKGLGDLALEAADHADARARYEEALLLYRRLDLTLGEANCIQRLGEVARENGEIEEARTKYNKALELFQKIQDFFSLGWTHLMLARIENDPALQRTYVDAAREAWAQIDRADLIEMLEEEFKPTETQ